MKIARGPVLRVALMERGRDGRRGGGGGPVYAPRRPRTGFKDAAGLVFLFLTPPLPILGFQILIFLHIFSPPFIYLHISTCRLPFLSIPQQSLSGFSLLAQISNFAPIASLANLVHLTEIPHQKCLLSHDQRSCLRKIGDFQSFRAALFRIEPLAPGLAAAEDRA